MEYENKFFLSDTKAFTLIKQVFNVQNPYNFVQIDFKIQIEKLKILKKIGISSHQLSRLTGIPKRIIKLA